MHVSSELHTANFNTPELATHAPPAHGESGRGGKAANALHTLQRQLEAAVGRHTYASNAIAAKALTLAVPGEAAPR